MINLSVAIITLNEQENLVRCLSSLPRGCEILVVDSGSEDKTVQIAEGFGAKVFTRKFDDFSSQKNFAIEKCKRKWVLSIDADEELNQELKSFIEDEFDTEKVDKACFRIRRNLVFNHKLMRFGKTNDRPIRLFPNSLRFKNAIHEEVDTDQLEVRKIPGSIIHYSYKDHSDYFRRFNSYTSKIAENHFMRGKKPNLLVHVIRPFFEFISRYFFRLGFLDGRNGFTYALYSSLYAYVKYEKLIEKMQMGEVNHSLKKEIVNE